MTIISVLYIHTIMASKMDYTICLYIQISWTDLVFEITYLLIWVSCPLHSLQCGWCAELPSPFAFTLFCIHIFFDMELQVVSLLENTKMIWKLMCPNPLSSMLVETWRICFSGERTHFYAFWRERTFQI